MFSLKLATLLFGLCLLVKSETTRNEATARYGELKNATSVSSTSSTTSSSRTTNGATCSSYVSKEAGSLLRPHEDATISCQCSGGSGSSDLLPCPNFIFLDGEDYINIEDRKLDLFPETCSLQYKLRIKPKIKVGTQRVTLACVIPGTDETFGQLDVYTDTPSPDHSPGARTRLSIYLVLAIVLFLLITLSLFGFLFRWQIRSRRRAQRSALCRSPFVQPQMNYGFAAGLGSDNPPSYNEATLPQSATVKVKLDKLPNLPQQQQQQNQRTGLQ